MTIEELKALATKVAEATNDTGILCFGSCGYNRVHMNKEVLLAMFGEVEKKESGIEKYPYEYSVMVDDVKFFAISEE